MKIYEAPELFVDEYVADTMIASAVTGWMPKNENADNNQNCWGCNEVWAQPPAGSTDPTADACMGAGYPGC